MMRRPSKEPYPVRVAQDNLPSGLSRRKHASVHEAPLRGIIPPPISPRLKSTRTYRRLPAAAVRLHSLECRPEKVLAVSCRPDLKSQTDRRHELGRNLSRIAWPALSAWERFTPRKRPISARM
jgi:hypothetical protein